MLPEGIVERWFIADGAIVAAGDPMAEIRIEDALHEIMAPVSGRLTIVAAANTVVKPGSLLARLAMDEFVIMRLMAIDVFTKRPFVPCHKFRQTNSRC